MGNEERGPGGPSLGAPAGVRLDDYVLQRRLPSSARDGADVWLGRERDGVDQVLVHIVALPSGAQVRDELVATARACVRSVGPQLAQGREVIVGEHALAMVWNVPSGRPWADAAGSPLELERGRGLAARLGWRLAEPSAGGAWVTDSGRVLVVPALRRLTEAAPDTSDAAAGARPANSTRRVLRARRHSRRSVVQATALHRAALLAAVLVVAVALGLMSIQLWRDPPAPAAQVDEQPLSGSVATTDRRESEPDWKAVLERLDAARATAFAAADPAAVQSFAVAGSPAAEQDRAVLGDLAAQGLRADGYAPVLEQVEMLTTDAGRAVLAVTDSVPAYRWLDGQGSVVREMASRSSAAWRLELREVDESWRIWAVSAAA